MTCVVGLVGTGDEAGSVLLAADSAGVVRGEEIHSLRNQKVYRVGSYLLGFTTSFRLGQVVRFGSMLPEPPSEMLAGRGCEVELEGFLATDWVAALRRALYDHGYEQALAAGGSLLVGVAGRLFVIGQDYQVLVAREPYAAIGSARLLAYGALATLEGLDAPELDLERRARIALQVAERFSPEVRRPFEVVACAVGQGPGATVAVPEAAC